MGPRSSSGTAYVAEPSAWAAAGAGTAEESAIAANMATLHLAFPPVDARGRTPTRFQRHGVFKRVVAYWLEVAPRVAIAGTTRRRQLR